MPSQSRVMRREAHTQDRIDRGCFGQKRKLVLAETDVEPLGSGTTFRVERRVTKYFLDEPLEIKRQPERHLHRYP